MSDAALIITVVIVVEVIAIPINIAAGYFFFRLVRSF